MYPFRTCPAGFRLYDAFGSGRFPWPRPPPVGGLPNFYPLASSGFFFTLGFVVSPRASGKRPFVAQTFSSLAELFLLCVFSFLPLSDGNPQQFSSTSAFFAFFMHFTTGLRSSKASLHPPLFELPGKERALSRSTLDSVSGLFLIGGPPPPLTNS